MKRKSDFDYLIIGAGPAGLQLGHELEQNGRDYMILEGADHPGAFFSTFPRHRRLLSINKVFTGYDDTEINLRWDWNSLLSDSDELLFKNYSKAYLPHADDLVRYLKDFATHFNLKVQTNTRIVHVTREEERFCLTSSEGDYLTCRRLIVATGLSLENRPPVPGIEHAELYSNVSVDPEDFKNQRVLIIGKGNSAFEMADSLIPTTVYIHVASPESLRLAWKSRFVGDLRAVNNNFLDTYQLKCQNAILDGIITKIHKNGDEYQVSISYSHAHGEKEVLTYDRIVLAAGFHFDNNIFDDPCRPRLAINDRFPEQTHEWESSSVPDLYFAGTLMQMRDFKKSTSSFIHGFRYCVRALSRIFEIKYHGASWPGTAIANDPEAVLESVISRVNRTSALWQQFGFFCDAILLGDGPEARYYTDVPIDYVTHGQIGSAPEFLLVTLEFGDAGDDPFAINRLPDAAHASKSAFLHPVIRYFVEGILQGEHHIIEDLHAEWRREDQHIRPFRQFLTEHLTKERMYASG